MNKPRSSAAGDKPVRNPLYVKIGKRIRQARSMARESNSRELSLRLGWSAGRIHNYETGLSTPGVEETLQFCAALGVDPCWITYGVGAPRPVELQSARYRRFIEALDAAERDDKVEAFLEAVRLPAQRLQKFRNHPHTRIPDTLARRCEKYLGRPRGWIDRAPAAADTDGAQAGQHRLLAIYANLPPAERNKLLAIGEVLAGELSPAPAP